MDLEKLLRDSEAAKQEAYAKRAKERQEAELAFTGYIRDFQERIAAALTSVTGIGPLTWDADRITSATGSEDLRTPLRGRTVEDGQPLVVEITSTLSWDTFTPPCHGAADNITINVCRPGPPSIKGTGYYRFTRSPGSNENYHVLPEDFRTALREAVYNLANA